MINLIPPSARRKVMFEYWVRVGSVWLLMIAIAFLTVALILYPTLVLVGGLVKGKEAALTESSAKTQEYDVSAKSLVQATALAKQVVDMRSQVPFTSFVATIDTLYDPASIAITSYQFQRTETGAVAPVTIAGNATTRQALAEFRDRLEAHPQFENIDLPITNLAKARDIDFSFTITVTASTTP